MVYLPNNLELIQKLTAEGYNALPYLTFTGEDKKIIKIGILNIMPVKIETEFHFASLLSKLDVDIEIYFLKFDSHNYKNTPETYLNKYYKSLSKMYDKMDLLILTGAAVEELKFTDVDYWEELTFYLDCIKKKRIPTINSCWSAMASLYHYYGIEKILITNKAFGVFNHTVITNDDLLNGLTFPFFMPVSRFSKMNEDQILSSPSLKAILSSDEVGIFLIKDSNYPFYYITGHPEYYVNILKNEYLRDMKIGKKGVSKPINYSLENPQFIWRQNAICLFNNIVKSIA